MKSLLLNAVACILIVAPAYAEHDTQQKQSERPQPAAEKVPNFLQIEQWVHDLNSREFAKREAAQKHLIKWNDLAFATLRYALLEQPAEERKRRIEKIMAEVFGSPEFEHRARLSHKEMEKVLTNYAEADTERKDLQQIKNAILKTYTPEELKYRQKIHEIAGGLALIDFFQLITDDKTLKKYAPLIQVSKKLMYPLIKKEHEQFVSKLKKAGIELTPVNIKDIDANLGQVLEHVETAKFMLAGAEKWKTKDGKEYIVMSSTGGLIDLRATDLNKKPSPPQSLQTLLNNDPKILMALEQAQIDIDPKNLKYQLEIDSSLDNELKINSNVKIKGLDLSKDTFFGNVFRAAGARYDNVEDTDLKNLAKIYIEHLLNIDSPAVLNPPPKVKIVPLDTKPKS